MLNDPINLVDPLGLAFSDVLPGIKKAIVDGMKGGAYAIGEAAKATVDIAMNGHPLAQAALGVALVSEAAPLVGAGAISAFPCLMTAAGTNAGQMALDFTNKAAWDIYGTGQPGFFYIGQKIWNFFNDLFSTRAACK